MHTLTPIRLPPTLFVTLHPYEFTDNHTGVTDMQRES